MQQFMPTTKKGVVWHGKTYSLAEVNRLTGIKIETIRTRAKRGKIETIKLDGEKRVTEAVLQTLLQSETDTNYYDSPIRAVSQ